MSLLQWTTKTGIDKVFAFDVGSQRRQVEKSDTKGHVKTFTSSRTCLCRALFGCGWRRWRDRGASLQEPSRSNRCAVETAESPFSFRGVPYFMADACLILMTLCAQRLQDPSQVAAAFASSRQRLLERAMQRCNINSKFATTKWYISQNLGFKICASYPALVAVPASVTDVQVAAGAKLWSGSRFPVWCWSSAKTSQWIVRGGSPKSSKGTDPFSVAFKSESMGEVEQIKVGSRLTQKAVQDSYLKLRALCVAEASGASVESATDIGWIPSWTGTKWPQLVQTVLGHALEATNTIETGGNVMLVGDEHGDSDCLVASVTMITIDAHYRTRVGFEELVQREWLAMGFAFSDRYVPLANTHHAYAAFRFSR